MPLDKIEIRGARQHNLKNVDLILPRDRLVVITGLSGSGQVVACLRHDLRRGPAPLRRVAVVATRASSWARWTSPTSSTSRACRRPSRSTRRAPATTRARPSARSPRSTTTCGCCSPASGGRIARSATDRSSSRPRSRSSTRSSTCPRARGSWCWRRWSKDRKGEYQSVFDDVRKAGFVRVRVDGEVRDLSETIELEKNIKALDRGRGRPAGRLARAEDKSRIADSIEQALKLGHGAGHHQPSRSTTVELGRHAVQRTFACPYDGTSLPPLEPRSFSFNTPHGACPTCTGLGTRLEVDPDLVLANKDLSLNQGAIAAWGKAGWNGNTYYKSLLESVAQHYGFSMDAPVRELSPGADRPHPVRLGQRADPDAVQSKSAAQSRVPRRTTKGVIPEHRAPLQRDRQRFHSRGPAALHGAAALPDLPWRAAQARGAGGHHRRSQSIAEVTGLLGARGARLLRRRSRSACRVGHERRNGHLPSPNGRPTSKSRSKKAAREDLVRRRARLGADRSRVHDRAPDPQGDPRAAAFSGRRRPRLSDAESNREHALRGRSAADSPGDADRVGPDGRAVHPRRAEHRPPPARQRAA